MKIVIQQNSPSIIEVGNYDKKHTFKRQQGKKKKKGKQTNDIANEMRLIKEPRQPNWEHQEVVYPQFKQQKMNI